MSWLSRIHTARLTDGRELHVVQPDPLAPWSAWLGDDRSAERSDRWLLSVLVRVLETPRGKAPEWVFALVDEFSSVETPLGRKFACPCCDS